LADPILLVKAAAAVFSDENTRKAAGWVLAAILSPLILLIAFFCALGSGAADHNISAVELCFYDTAAIPENTPGEYRVCIEAMRASFAQLDNATAAIQENTEGETSLDDIRVKAIFYALYFGAESHGDPASFADCFVAWEERTRTVPVAGSNPSAETEEIYRVAIPIEDLGTVWRNIAASMGMTPTAEQQTNADSVYNLIRYGAAGGGSGFAGSDVPFIGADGFCSPIGEHWRNVVTSEFGNRVDPITGQRDGHSGMDLAVPTGTAIRAALPGTVTAARYHYSYGYYVMIDHGNGLATLYAHNSQLLVRAGQTVEAGDVVSLSGSTGRVTGPHLHFEVRLNGERTNPRSYLP